MVNPQRQALALYISTLINIPPESLVSVNDGISTTSRKELKTILFTVSGGHFYARGSVNGIVRRQKSDMEMMESFR